MADLLSDNTDFEASKYYDADEMFRAGFDPAIVKEKKSVFNAETKMNDIVMPMPSGGYVKIGEEAPEVMTEAPDQPMGMVAEDMPPEVSPQSSVEGAQAYEQELRDQGIVPTAADLEAAGYSPETVEQMQPSTPEIKPLSEEEIAQVVADGGSLLGDYDPTIREEGVAAIKNYIIEAATEGLRDELIAQGASERQIEEEIKAAMPEFMSDSEVLTNLLFGTGNPLGVGVGDFTTAGVMDMQEGYRMFNASREEAGDSLAGRALGMGIMAAGLAEATGVGYAFGKMLKKGLVKLQPAISQMGLDAEQRIAQEGDMLFSNPVGPIVDRGLAAAGRLVAPKLEDGLPGRISTRLPTAKAATEDPMSGELIVGLDEMKTDPALYDFNVNITRDYPNMKVVEGEETDQTAERFIDHVKENLLYLHDKVPADTRVRSQKWYDGARAITDNWSEEYGVPDTSIAGVLAALSPQKDWYQNVSLGQRVLDVAVKQRDFKFTPEMEAKFRDLPSLNKPKYEPMLELIKGKSYAEIVDEDPAVQATLRAMFVRLYDQTYNKPDYQIVGPEGDFLEFATTASGDRKKAAWGSLNEIGKAVASIDANGEVNTISRLMGERHKVRNFYNNIYDPNSPFGDVTIDTHAVAAGLLRPLSGNSLEVDHNFKNMSVKGRGTTKGSAKTGVSGNYGLYAEAYRRAAAERGILPRQMQSITWEAVRGLFTDKFKQSAKNVADVDAIWQRYKDGELDLDETRRLVDERAGGINPPTWE